MSTSPTPPSPVTTDAATSALLQASRTVARQRWRVAATLTAGMVVIYFGFILLVAFRPASLGVLVADGLSIGIVLGIVVILAAWVLTYAYVSWANRVYDPALATLRATHGNQEATP
ncbi:MAG: hypothetical protein RLZZ621_1168 [Gemmatimonadota bacterium]